jgi:hypothetical protein
MAQVRTHAKIGIADHRGLDRQPHRLEDVVDDAAVLHMLAEQAEPYLRRLRPSNRFPARKPVGAMRDEDIALAIEGRPPHVLQRLIHQLSQSGVDLKRVEPALDGARRHGLNLDRRGRMRGAEARGQK